LDVVRAFGYALVGDLILESVAHLPENFTRIVKVKAAKGEAVIHQDVAVSYIGCSDGCDEFIAEALPDREIEGSVLGQVRVGVSWIGRRPVGLKPPFVKPEP
jgi:hypothetical protein